MYINISYITKYYLAVSKLCQIDALANVYYASCVLRSNRFSGCQKGFFE